MGEQTPRDNFKNLFTRLARVPKREIDAQERKYAKTERSPAKPRAMIPTVEPKIK